MAVTLNKKINDLNLERVVQRVIKEYSWAEEDVRELEVQYRRFLYICFKYPGERVAPFLELDLFWHEHILHTKHYMESCQDILGRYLHHFPADPDETDEKEIVAAYEKTLSLIMKEFPDAE